MTDPTYSPALRALFGPPTPDQRLEWLDGLCATRTATRAQIDERNRLRLKLARAAASNAFSEATDRYGERAARQAFSEAVGREAQRPADQKFNQRLLETYDWFKEVAEKYEVRNFRMRAIKLIAGATGKTEDAVTKQLERLLDKRKS